MVFKFLLSFFNCWSLYLRLTDCTFFFRRLILAHKRFLMRRYSFLGRILRINNKLGTYITLRLISNKPISMTMAFLESARPVMPLSKIYSWFFMWTSTFSSVMPPSGPIYLTPSGRLLRTLCTLLIRVLLRPHFFFLGMVIAVICVSVILYWLMFSLCHCYLEMWLIAKT